MLSILSTCSFCGRAWSPEWCTVMGSSCIFGLEEEVKEGGGGGGGGEQQQLRL